MEHRNCTTHHVCDCIQERLDRIDAVWQKYKHMDKEIPYLQDKIAIDVLYDLWRAIRREE